MRILAFSDLHRDLDAARAVVERSAGADVVVGAGDLAVVHEGLEETVAALSAIEIPTVLVPGNNETDEALRGACEGWEASVVLHGTGTEIDGVPFYGLGAGVPVTPWEWSFDLDEQAAGRMLAGCPEGAVLISHSPPKGHADRSSDGTSLGSTAVLEAIESRQPRLVLCGHIHESWGERSTLGESLIVNLGPGGAELDA